MIKKPFRLLKKCTGIEINSIMYEVETDKIISLQERLNHLLASLNLDRKKARLGELGKLTSAPDLWNDGDKARILLKEQQILKKFVSEAEAIKTRVDDFIDFAKMASDFKR